MKGTGLRHGWMVILAALALAGPPVRAQPAPAAPETIWAPVHSDVRATLCRSQVPASLAKLGYQVTQAGPNAPIQGRHGSGPLAVSVFCGDYSVLVALTGTPAERAARAAERTRLAAALEGALTTYAKAAPPSASSTSASASAPRLAALTPPMAGDECVTAALAVLREAGYPNARYESGLVVATHGAHPASASLMCGSLGNAYLVLAAAPGDGFDPAAEGARLTPILTQRAMAELEAARARAAAEFRRKTDEACRALDTAGGVAAATWTWLDHRRELGFAMSFPTHPCITTAQGPGGRETLYTAVVDGVAYTLSVRDAGAGAADAVLDAEVDALGREGVTVLSAKKTPMGTDPGSIVWTRRTLPSGAEARATLRYVVHGGRLYRLGVAYPTGRDVAADMQRFGEALKF